MNAKRIGLILGASLCMAACGELDEGSTGPGGGPMPKSTVQFDLVDSPDFYGNSVWICGQRVDEHGDPLPADSKYPCLNEICECFDFTASGGLIEIPQNGLINGGAPRRGALEDLCPSDNIPEAQWRFRYEIRSETECHGEILNGRGNPNNFACFDSLDVYDQDHPNKSIEWLSPGPNHNEVICLTRNAKKTWDFDVCVDETYPREAEAGILRADCGCVPEEITGIRPVPQLCVCDQELGELPPNCTVSIENWCDVVCTPPVPVCDNPGVCYHYEPCDPTASSCYHPVCAATAEGGTEEGICVDSTVDCLTLHSCRTTADCADDGICVVGSCCGRNVCVTPDDFCGNVGDPELSVPTNNATIGAPALAW